MVRMTEWMVTFGGVEFRLKPITVRQRLALSEDMASDKAKAAAEDARLADMTASERAEHIGEARRKALMASALFLDAYSIHGGIRILSAALGDVDKALDLVGRATPREATRVCLEALGIDTDTLDADAASSGTGKA
jgi:hypothetical protein